MAGTGRAGEGGEGDADDAGEDRAGEVEEAGEAGARRWGVDADMGDGVVYLGTLDEESVEESV